MSTPLCPLLFAPGALYRQKFMCLQPEAISSLAETVRFLSSSHNRVPLSMVGRPRYFSAGIVVIVVKSALVSTCMDQVSTCIGRVWTSMDPHPSLVVDGLSGGADASLVDCLAVLSV